MAKKKTKKNLTVKRPSRHSPEQRVYEVTSEPIIEQSFRLLPESIQQELNGIYKKLESAPKSVIARLLELKQQFPKTPLIGNFLTVAYGQVDREKQIQAIEENYRLYPDYLFARCHYADLCLQQGKWERVPEVFEHCFDLKSLYPRRNRFHISEYTAFAAALIKYYTLAGEREQAEELLQSLKYLSPDGAVTKQLDAMLHPGLLRRWLAKIIAKLEA